MRYNPDIHHRHSIRLKGYDYSSNGAYFITICAQDWANLFGEIVGADLVSAQAHGADVAARVDTRSTPTDSKFARMELNHAGKMIDKIWNETIGEYQNIHSEKYVIMPNHFHCILVISNPDVGVDLVSALPSRAGNVAGADTRSAPTVATIIQAFKSKTTVEYIKGVKSGIYPGFNKRIWQRNYYERIIRDKAEHQ